MAEMRLTKAEFLQRMSEREVQFLTRLHEPWWQLQQDLQGKTLTLAEAEQRMASLIADFALTLIDVVFAE